MAKLVLCGVSWNMFQLTPCLMFQQTPLASQQKNLNFRTPDNKEIEKTLHFLEPLY